MPSRTQLSRSLREDDYPGLGRYVWRPEDGKLDWSSGLAEIYGRKATPTSEADFMACLHPDDRLRIEGETEAFLTGGADSYSHSFRIVRPDGEVRYIIDRARIERDADGRVTEIHGLNMDVTDFPHLARGSMDEELRASEAEAAGAIRALPDHARLEVGLRTCGLVLADIDYRAGMIRLSGAAARLYGLGEAAMTLPRSVVHAAIHPEDRAALAAQIEASLDPKGGGRLSAEHRIRRPDGTVRWLQVQKRIDFGTRDDGRLQPDRGVLAAVDITERKIAEIALRESEERLALAQGVAGIGVWDVDLATGRSIWTGELYDLLQIDRTAPASPDLFFEKVHPDDVVGLRQAFDTAIAENSPFNAEFRVLPDEGVTRYFVGQGRVVEEKDDRASRMVGVNYDVTDRTLAEIRLRESEARLRQASEAAGFGVHQFDVARQDAHWSPQTHHILGTSDDGPKSIDQILSTVHPEDRDRVQSEMAAI